MDLVDGIKQPFTLELFLRREPAEDEIDTIRTHAARFCAARVARESYRTKGCRRSRLSCIFATANLVTSWSSRARSCPSTWVC